MASSLVLIQGTEEFLVLRKIRDLVRDHESQGYEIRTYDASLDEDASALMSSTGFSLFGGREKIVGVVQNPHKLDMEWILDLLQNPNPDLAVILHVSGTLAKNTRLYKQVYPALKSKGLALQLDQPPQYKLEEYAVNFLQSEMTSRHHKFLDERLARSIVSRAGTDLGVLSFEAWKLSLLETEEIVSVDSVRGSVSTLARVEIGDLIESLTYNDVSKVMKVLLRMKQTWSSDPTMAICGMLTPTMFRWAKALSLEGSGIPPSEAAEILSVNPWFWEHVVLPDARKLGISKIRNLLELISEIQFSVRNGTLSPWILLETGLIRIVES